MVSPAPVPLTTSQSYTFDMAITLDPVTEQRVQKQLARGAFAEPSELLAHALDLVEAEEDWLLRNRRAIQADLNESFAEAARGEGYSLEEFEAALAERRVSRLETHRAG
jgi:Arc/MetJ-type ribon-helix-helix transcriptional regulator